MQPHRDVHIIRPGDTFYGILSETYGPGKFRAERAALVAAVQAANPYIADINRIYPGRALVLPALAKAAPVAALAPPSPQDCAINQKVCELVERISPESRDILIGLEALNAAAGHMKEYDKVVNTASGVYDGLGKLSKLARQSYEAQAKNLQFTQALMKEKKLVQSSYYQNRVEVLKAQDHKFRLIRDRMGKQITPTSKVLRISQNEAGMAKSLDKSLSFANDLGKRAKVAGRAFGVLSAGVGVVQYAGERDARKRSVIVLETAGGMAAGSAASLAVTAALVSNPVGWGVILGVVVISVSAGYIGSKLGEVAGEALHDTYGSPNRDVVQALFD